MISTIALSVVFSVFSGLPTVETTQQDQQEVAVTAYNQGVALVREVRSVSSLPKEEFILKFEEVPSQIKPESVSLRSLSKENSFEVIEQNYQYDLIRSNNLLEKYVGKEVKLMNFSKDSTFEPVKAEVLSVPDMRDRRNFLKPAVPVFRINQEIYLDHPGSVVLPDLPDNLVSKPTLMIQAASESAQQTLEAVYLTGGITWNADYTLKLSSDEKIMSLNGWVTLINMSGASFKNAKLKLVAGNVNVSSNYRVNEENFDTAMAGGYEMARRYGQRPQLEGIGEYHLYTMPRPTSILQNQTKQLALLEGAGIGCVKKYEYRGNTANRPSRPDPSAQKEQVGVYIEFKNEAANHLGIPLPGGIIRVYQGDSEGALQFVGEDAITHTPKDEKVSVKMGKRLILPWNGARKTSSSLAR